MSKTVILVTRQGLGTTAPEDADFGLEMLDKFFHTLERQAEKPHAICFYTDGVHLLAAGSALVLSLKLLESLGVPSLPARAASTTTACRIGWPSERSEACPTSCS